MEQDFDKKENIAFVENLVELVEMYSQEMKDIPEDIWERISIDLKDCKQTAGQCRTKFYDIYEKYVSSLKNQKLN
jgi:hypothetical protein